MSNDTTAITTTAPAVSEKRAAVLHDYTDPRLARLDEAFRKTGLIKGAQGDATPFTTAIRYATAMKAVRDMLTADVLASICELQNTSLGFLTDDRERGYAPAVVRDVVVEACARGVPVVGNCFNILSGRLYITKEGMKYLLDHVQGLRYEITPLVPNVTREPSWGQDARGKAVPIPGEAVVPVDIFWSINGADGSARREYPTKVNNRMTTEALMGKAWRKAAAWLYEAVTGTAAPEGDVTDATPVSSTVASKPAAAASGAAGGQSKLAAALKLEA